MEKLLTKAELLSALNISRSTYDRLIREGLPCIRLGTSGQRRFDIRKVTEWFEDRASQPPEV